MDITKSIATDYTVPFRTRERQGALPTLAPVQRPGPGDQCARRRHGCRRLRRRRPRRWCLQPTTGEHSAYLQASPL